MLNVLFIYVVLLLFCCHLAYVIYQLMKQQIILSHCVMTQLLPAAPRHLLMELFISFLQGHKTDVALMNILVHLHQLQAVIVYILTLTVNLARLIFVPHSTAKLCHLLRVRYFVCFPYECVWLTGSLVPHNTADVVFVFIEVQISENAP